MCYIRSNLWGEYVCPRVNLPYFRIFSVLPYDQSRAVWPVRVSDVLGNAKFASLSLLLNVCKVEFGLLLIATAIGQYRLHASLKAL